MLWPHVVTTLEWWLFAAAEACQAKRVYVVFPMNADLAAGKCSFLADLGLVANPGVKTTTFVTKQGTYAFEQSSSELRNVLGTNACKGTQVVYQFVWWAQIGDMKLRVFDRCETESRVARSYIVSMGYSAEWIIPLPHIDQPWLCNIGLAQRSDDTQIDLEFCREQPECHAEPHTLEEHRKYQHARRRLLHLPSGK